MNDTVMVSRSRSVNPSCLALDRSSAVGAKSSGMRVPRVRGIGAVRSPFSPSPLLPFSRREGLRRLSGDGGGSFRRVDRTAGGTGVPGFSRLLHPLVLVPRGDEQVPPAVDLVSGDQTTVGECREG